MAKKPQNIYQIVDIRDHSVVATGFTRKEAKRTRGKVDKLSAKAKRDELNAAVKGESNPFIISRGNDHPLGETNGISVRRRGKNSLF